MSVELSFILLALTIVGGGIYGVRRYNTLFNPLTVFCAVDMGVFTLMSGIVAWQAQRTLGHTYPDEIIAQTALISIVFLLGNIAAHLYRGPVLAALFGKLMRGLGLDSETIGGRYSGGKMLLLGGIGVLAMVLVAVLGGGGSLWLTNPRMAYADYRLNVLPIYSLYQWVITWAYTYYLWARRPRGLHMIAVLVVSMLVMVVTGSKGVVLNVAVITTVYFNFYVRRMTIRDLLLILPLAFLYMLQAIMFLEGRGSLLESLLYFRDYFDTAAQFLNRFDEFGYRYGGGQLSALWFYVPRGLYQAKPFEFGNTLIHKVLFPGSAEVGYTPGMLQWPLAYMDFGIAGVFLDGLTKAVWQKAAWDYYQQNTRRYFAWIMIMQLSLYPIFFLAPPFITFALAIAMAFLLRMRLVAGVSPVSASRQPAPSASSSVPEGGG